MLVLLKLGYRESEALEKSRGEIRAICRAYDELNNPPSPGKKFKVRRQK